MANVAIESLRQAVRVPGHVEDRQVRQPDSWLLRRCWQVLAEAGFGPETFMVFNLMDVQGPLVRYHVLYQLAQHVQDDAAATAFVVERLRTLRPAFFVSPGQRREEQVERLLWVAGCAALAGIDPLAFACLEWIDQIPGIWRTLFARQELRELLAETIACVGLHPLTSQLIAGALRRHGDAGAQFLQFTAAAAGQHIADGRNVARTRRLLHRCVQTIRHATLTSLTSRRFAVSVLAHEGLVDEILEQMTVIANIQEARRESGLAPRDSEQLLLRQVRRAKANADVDFQLYTLKEAVQRLPVARLTATQQRSLAEKLAELGSRSDGWTAAAAVSALVAIDALQQAIDVVALVDRQDPTRSEGVLELVQGLLAAGEEEMAEQETENGVQWAQSLRERHPERLVIWGLAKAYLAHGKAQKALDILAQRRPPAWRVRIRRFFRNVPTEDDLREESLRLQAAIQQGEGAQDRATYHLTRICEWAPQLLEGKALALFYSEHVLQPLLAAGQDKLAWQLLPDVQTALTAIVGREQPARVEEVARLLVARLERIEAGQPGAGPVATEQAGEPAQGAEEASRLDEAKTAANDLLLHLWQANAEQGIWQTVYAIGGSLSLVLAVAGPEAMVQIARFTAAEGQAWQFTEPAVAKTAKPELV